MTMKIERWCFTSDELYDLKACRGTDEFFASISSAPGHEHTEYGVIVLRNGTVTHSCTHGMPPSDEEADLAADEDTLYRLDDTAPSDVWHDVITDEKGKFHGFALKAGVREYQHYPLEHRTNFSSFVTLEEVLEFVKSQYAMYASDTDMMREFVIPIIPVVST